MKTGALAVIALLVTAACAGDLHAAKISWRQQILNSAITRLEQTIAPDSASDSTNLTAATAQFLKELKAAALRGKRADMELAALRYSAELESLQASELDPRCAPKLLFNVGQNAFWMAQELVSGDPPACFLANLTSQAAGITSARYGYDICLIDQSEQPNYAVRTELEKKQNIIDFSGWVADAIVLYLCTPDATQFDYYSLWGSFLGFF